MEREIVANYVDIVNRRIFPCRFKWIDKRISSIEHLDFTVSNYILPGFIDAHVHIESSLLAPSEFARMAVTHGTIATVSDPHEIGNVLGVHGVEFMLENARDVPFHFHFGAPSCVPATKFETAGASIDVLDIDLLLQNKEIHYLAEMMNFPGVIYHEEEVMAKLALANKYGKPIDGHAPGLTGEDAVKYFREGPSTDHECFSLEEALEKLRLGVKIIIREGSAARNYQALSPLIKYFPDQLMFCSDDKHPDTLIDGHINQIVARTVNEDHDIFNVLKIACINPATHYKMKVGQLKLGDNADFIIVEDLKNFKVIQTFIHGQVVAENGKTLIKPKKIIPENKFNIDPIDISDLKYTAQSIEKVIGCFDGQLVTESLQMDGSDCIPENDVLKIVVVNRYREAPIAMAYIKNFGLKQGAIASSVAHDSHNIIATGVSDKEILNAINLVIDHKGGLSAVNGAEKLILPLPIAGLMSDKDAWDVAALYTELDKFCKNELGSTLTAPFMTLSFMALLVIPSLKLSDMGLFDGNKFEFINNSDSR